VILGGAIISIVLNPALFALLDRKTKKEPGPAAEAAPVEAPKAVLRRAVLVGYGRVGSLIGKALDDAGVAYAVIEDRTDLAENLEGQGISTVMGNATSLDALAAAGVKEADLLFVTVPDGFEAGAIVEQARKLNPQIKVYARAHSDAEVEHLQQLGANLVVSGEREIADAMIERASAIIPRRVTRAS